MGLQGQGAASHANKQHEIKKTIYVPAHECVDMSISLPATKMTNIKICTSEQNESLHTHTKEAGGVVPACQSQSTQPGLVT